MTDANIMERIRRNKKVYKDPMPLAHVYSGFVLKGNTLADLPDPFRSED